MKGVLQVLAQSAPSALSCTASGRDVLLAESRKSVPSDVKVTLDPPGWPGVYFWLGGGDGSGQLWACLAWQYLACVTRGLWSLEPTSL